MYTTNKTTFESIYDATTYAALGSCLISGIIAIIIIMDYIIHGNNGTISPALMLGIISLAFDMFLMVVLVAMTFCKVVFK